MRDPKQAKGCRSGDFSIRPRAERLRVAQAVKPFRVNIPNGIFVGLSQAWVFVEFFELGLAGVVVDLVRKIRGKDEWFVADDADGKGQGQLVALDADEDPSLVRVPPDVVGDRFPLAQLQKATARIILHMAIPGALEPFDAVDEPARARFHKTEADVGVFIEDAIE